MRTFSKYIHKHYLVILLPVLILTACKKQKIDTPTFDVTADNTTVAVGQPIVFTFSGTADDVALYTGAAGSEYRYKTRTTVDGKPQLQFTTTRTGTSTQTNTLSLLISNNFTNVFDLDNLAAGTWKDITSRATLSTGTANTASGVIDLSDQISGNTPVYIAYRYTAKKDAAVAQPTWTVNNFAINNIGTDGTNVAISTMATMNWGTISVLNSTNLWTFNTTALTFTGGAINADDNDDWIISQPIQLNRAPATRSINVKVSPTTRLTTYVFAGYAAAGTYTASFEATNANTWDIKSVVKQITITVK